MEMSDQRTPEEAHLTKKNRRKAIKPAATREQVYRFAWGAIEAGFPEMGATAVICFEFWVFRESSG
jgi:hypothetical protein